MLKIIKNGLKYIKKKPRQEGPNETQEIKNKWKKTIAAKKSVRL